jgi:hypothetical protein
VCDVLPKVFDVDVVLSGCRVDVNSTQARRFKAPSNIIRLSGTDLKTVDYLSIPVPVPESIDRTPFEI